MASEKGNVAKIAAGGGSAAVGGAILLKTLKTKKISPKEKKELVEVVKKEVKEAGNKKAGDYIYQRALRTRGARKAAHKASVRAAGSQGAGWFARGYSDINNNSGMEIRRKVFSLLQDESGEERYYSTTEFELSYDEAGEKLFSEKESKIERTGRGYITSLDGNGINGPIAVRSGRRAAKKAEKEGKSESEIIEAAGKKASKVSGALNTAAGATSAVAAGVIAHKLSKNPEIRKTIKEAVADSPEIAQKLAKLGKGKKVGAIAAGLAAASVAPAIVHGARRAGDGARKNVTKGLVKGHKKSEEKAKSE